jgi:hypothetical protein
MSSRSVLLPCFLLLACLWPCSGDEPSPPSALPAPKRVTHAAGKQPLSKVLAELTRQTGIRVEDRRGEPDGEIQVELNAMPFWQALDRIAAAAQARVDLYPRDGRITLAKRPPSYETPPLYYDGPFRCVLKGMTGSRDYETGAHGYRASLEVAWEPDLLPLLLETRPQNTILRDDKNQTIPVPDQGSSQASVDGRSVLLFDVPLPALPRSVQRIGLFQGQLSVVVPTKMLTFTFDSLDRLAREKDKGVLSQEGVVCKISRVVLADDRWTVQVTLEYPPGGKTFDSYQSWVVNNEMVLEPVNGGKPFPSTSYVLESSTSRRAVVSYHFLDKDKQVRDRPEQWKVRYRTPAALVETPVRFVFRDVRLL